MFRILFDFIVDLYNLIEIPKKALLQKISNLRRDRQQQQQATTTNRAQSADYTKNESQQALTSSDADMASLQKRQLILCTIEDLKRNLEDQSIELNGLNDDD